jgi:hypothetical protein
MTILLFLRKATIFLAAGLVPLFGDVMIPGSAKAAVISYQFSGTWNDAGAYNGTGFTGLLTLDDAEPDLLPADSSRGLYSSLGSMSVTLVDGTVFSGGSDNLRVRAYPEDPWGAGSSWQPQLSQPMGTMNGSPLALLDMSLRVFGSLLGDGILPIFDGDPNFAFSGTGLSVRYGQQSGLTNTISGKLTSLAVVSPVPLPPALPTLAAGIALLGLLGWRKISGAASI